MNIFTRYMMTVYTHMLLLMLLIVVANTDELYNFAQRTDALHAYVSPLLPVSPCASQVFLPKHCDDGKQSTLAEVPKATTAC